MCGGTILLEQEIIWSHSSQFRVHITIYQSEFMETQGCGCFPQEIMVQLCHTIASFFNLVEVFGAAALDCHASNNQNSVY